ncbi:hypothetical protein QUF72_06565 [Desulfobacterales bacterium HSG2]|nr:hypothetical protein [Desulfobacterales bacterium HSG2]
MKTDNFMRYIFIFIVFVIGCEKFAEMGKEAFEKHDLMTQEIRKALGTEPEISWRVHNGKTIVHIHFEKLPNEEITVGELKKKVCDIVKKVITTEIDTLLISVDGKQ